jgi:outer membrane protein OmpA-like peptidoglycan-associated protein
MKNAVLCVIVMAGLCLAEIERANPAPTITRQGTNGLVNTFSAEPLGSGRLTFSLLGTWYRQQNEFLGAPEKGVDVITGNGAVSLGANSQIDLFATVSSYAMKGYQGENLSGGKGGITGGVQMALPFRPTFPLRLAAQAVVGAGISGNQINTNGADGYNYFETRIEHDFTGRLIQTLSFVAGQTSLKIHANEAIVAPITGSNGNLLLLAGGLQTCVHPACVLGLELNSRVFLNQLYFRSDPFWITPSLQFRTPYNMNATVGVDISFSNERPSSAIKALEPYRLFGGLAFSFDTKANERRAEAEKEQQEVRDKAALEAEKKQLTASVSSMTKKAVRDSLASVVKQQAERARADSIARKAKEDSVAMMRKAAQDSMDMAKKLEEERSKRTESEKQLLSTGLLLLDAVYFETGKTTISINSKPALNLIGQWLEKYPKLNLEVGGHTDNVGGPKTNTKLSQARAESVARYLVLANPGLEGHILAKGYGPSMPKADNKTADGRQQNRRVELKVLNKEVLKEYQ